MFSEKYHFAIDIVISKIGHDFKNISFSGIHFALRCIRKFCLDNTDNIVFLINDKTDSKIHGHKQLVEWKVRDFILQQIYDKF